MDHQLPIPPALGHLHSKFSFCAFDESVSLLYLELHGLCLLASGLLTHVMSSGSVRAGMCEEHWWGWTISLVRHPFADPGAASTLGRCGCGSNGGVQVSVGAPAHELVKALPLLPASRTLPPPPSPPSPAYQLPHLPLAPGRLGASVSLCRGLLDTRAEPVSSHSAPLPAPHAAHCGASLLCCRIRCEPSGLRTQDSVLPGLVWEHQTARAPAGCSRPAPHRPSGLPRGAPPATPLSSGNCRGSSPDPSSSLHKTRVTRRPVAGRATEGTGLCRAGHLPRAMTMPLSEEIPCFYFKQ